jgi:hypothetical protein
MGEIIRGINFGEGISQNTTEVNIHGAAQMLATLESAKRTLRSMAPNEPVIGSNLDNIKASADEYLSQLAPNDQKKAHELAA